MHIQAMTSRLSLLGEGRFVEINVRPCRRFPSPLIEQ